MNCTSSSSNTSHGANAVPCSAAVPVQRQRYLELHVIQQVVNGIDVTATAAAAAAAGLPEVTAWLRQHSGTNFCSKLRKVWTASMNGASWVSLGVQWMNCPA
jgi:hypothetical protein